MSFFQPMIDVLVLGGNSQDGKTLIDLSKNSDLKFIFVARSKTKVKHFDEELVFVSDYSIPELADLLSKYNPRYVLNLIGQSSVGKSFVIPEETYRINYHMAKNIFNFVVCQSKAHFIQASTAYIFDCSTPIGPTSKIRAISPYADSKAKFYTDFKEGNLDSSKNRLTFLHLFNHVSKYSDRRFVLPKILSSFRTSCKFTDLTLENAHKSRDWGLSEDYMKIVMQLCSYDSQSLNYEYFIGSGLQLKLLDIVKSLEGITGIKCRLHCFDGIPRDHDPDYVILSNNIDFQGISLPKYTTTGFCKSLLSFK